MGLVLSVTQRDPCQLQIVTRSQVIIFVSIQNDCAAIGRRAVTVNTMPGEGCPNTGEISRMRFRPRLFSTLLGLTRTKV